MDRARGTLQALLADRRSTAVLVAAVAAVAGLALLSRRHGASNEGAAADEARKFTAVKPGDAAALGDAASSPRHAVPLRLVDKPKAAGAQHDTPARPSATSSPTPAAKPPLAASTGVVSTPEQLPTPGGGNLSGTAASSRGRASSQTSRGPPKHPGSGAGVGGAGGAGAGSAQARTDADAARHETPPPHTPMLQPAGRSSSQSPVPPSVEYVVVGLRRWSCCCWLPCYCALQVCGCVLQSRQWRQDWATNCGDRGESAHFQHSVQVHCVFLSVGSSWTGAWHAAPAQVSVSRGHEFSRGVPRYGVWR